MNVSSFSGDAPTCMFVSILPILLARLPDPDPAFARESLFDGAGVPPWSPNSTIADCLNTGMIKSAQDARAILTKTKETTSLRIDFLQPGHPKSPPVPVVPDLNREQRRRLAQAARAAQRKPPQGDVDRTGSEAEPDGKAAPRGKRK